MADDGDGGGARPVIVRPERAPHLDGYSQHREQLRRDQSALDVLWLSRGADGASAIGPRSDQERATLTPQIGEIGIREPPELAELFRGSMQREEPFRLRIREWPQENAVDDGEHDGRRADAQGEHQQGDGRKARHPAQRANRVLDVLEQVLHPARPTGVAAELLHLLRTTERQPRLSPRVVRMDAARHEICHALVLVKKQLSREIVLHPPSTPQPKPPVHSAPVAVIRRINATASAKRRQLAVSISSCALPLPVRR